MKKTLLLFLFLLPFLGISQNVELVKWDNSGYGAHVLVPISQVTAPPISGNNLANTNSSGYSSTQWPVGNAINPDKYIQIGIKAEEGYKIDLSSIKFTYLTVNQLTDSPKKFQVRYLKGSQSTWTILEDYQISSKINNETITLPPAFTLLPGETVYFRFYGYDRANTYWDGATWGLVNSLTTDGGKYSVPTIIGKVSPYIPGITANDDSVTIYQNNFAFINVLNNDLAGTNPISSVSIASQSANGTAVVGSDNRIKFTPTAGFTGPTSFTYKIGDGTNTSTATVNVNVITSAAVSLVEWSGPDNTLPTITAPPAAVAAESFTVGPGTQLALQPQGDGYNGYGWPTQFSIDESKYFEFTTSAKTGYKLKLDKFNFTYNQDTNHFIERYQVRYSKDNFATSFLLVDEPANMGKTNKSLDLSNVTLYPNEKITIRIYGYKLRSRQNPNSPIFLANAASRSQGETVPTITGTVLSYDEKDLNANDDLVSTQENRAIAFDPLVNDVHTTGATITYTQPPSTAGTVSANGTIFTFKPATNFKGKTTFTYTLTSGAQNSTATVTVYVNELSPKLIIWNGILQTPKAVVTDPNIEGKDLTVGGSGVSFRNDLNEFFVIGLQNGGSTAENLNKYIEVSVTPKAKYNLTLTEFKFRYKSPGSQGANMFQVRYSKDKNFPDNGTVLLGPTVAVKDTETDIAIPFPSGTRVLSNNSEIFYIRIYPYAVSDLSNGYFILKNNDGGDIGPTLTGIVEPSNLITAVADFATVSSSEPTPISILANDENYTPLVSITTTQPSVGGSVQVNGTTNVIFTPTPGFMGKSTFEYTIFNGLNYSTATVTLNVKCEAPGNQTDYGQNQWIGYVYKFTNNANMPPHIILAGLPDPNTVTYIGKVTENKNFDRDMGDGAVRGLTTEIPCEAAPTDRFFVRYKMRVDITQAGVYRFDLGSDDGIRLFIDNNEVLSRWGNRGYANDTYSQRLEVGSYNFILEYYEDGGLARNSFFFGLPEGNPAEFGDKVWNVYGYENNDITLQNVKYAGYYVDPHLDPYSTNYWPKDKSPSAASIWKGVQVPNDNFTVVFKRKGFDCGRYKIQHVNHDDVVEIFIDGVSIYYNDVWNTPSLAINNGKLYALNSDSRVEIRLRENGGDANLSIQFIKTDVPFTNGSGDESGSNLVVNGNVSLNSDLTVCSCTVNSGGTLTVNKNATLTVDEDIKVNGKLLILDGGSLMQTSTSKSLFTSNSTDAFEIQRIAKVARYDLTYWGVPVKNDELTMKKFSPNTLIDKYFTLDSATSSWTEIYNGQLPMIAGNGYSIRAPQDFPSPQKQEFTGKFTGIPNNGDIPVTVVQGKWNLIGNPYPSAIYAPAFIGDNENIGALYLWAHVNLPKKGPDGFYYYDDDFVVTTGLGSNSTDGVNYFNGYIGAAQGFIVKAPTSTVHFKNGQRQKGNNTQFYKTDQSNIEMNRIWLNFTNTTGTFKQILLGYATGATNAIDVNFDATSMNSNPLIDFYSVGAAKKLTIQGRALPFEKSDVVPLGYMLATKGDYTISIDHADGLFNEGQDVYLEDKTLGKITNLRLENYTFTTAAGTFNNRFAIRYTNKTLGTDDFENIENGVLVSFKSKIVNVSSSTENISEVQIYNISGQTVYSKNKIDSKELQVANLQSGNQVLLVKVILENGAVVTKKIISN